MQEPPHPLQLAIEELKNMPTVNIKGKSYTQVSTRISVFRKYFPYATIETFMIHDDDYRVIVQSKIKIDDKIIATGYAEEVRNGNLINSTSAVENCETSSIGRALSAFGFAGGEYASSFEVANAVAQQTQNQSMTSKPEVQQQKQNHRQTPARQTQPQQNQSNQQSFSPHEFSSLYSLGLQILEQGQNLVIVGDRDIIFNSKDSIKAHSFHWSSQNKHWYRAINQQHAA